MSGNTSDFFTNLRLTYFAIQKNRIDMIRFFAYSGIDGT